jgi:hypothetical protein
MLLMMQPQRPWASTAVDHGKISCVVALRVTISQAWQPAP